MKDIPGFEGRYAITEDGMVWSYPKGRNNKEGKFLAPVRSHGYFNVSLCGNGNIEVSEISRLVALTYIPNPENHPVVRHLDDNKQNNHISNLEWCTHRTNIKQALAKKIMQLTKDGILCRIYDSVREAADITGLAGPNISCCATGVQKTCGGYVWQYI